MGRENTLGFKICFENVDLALAENIARDRKNIIIFMCVNDISQTILGEKLGYNRSTVSKNLNTNINTASSFKERFCEVFGFNNVELNYDPIVFYYICCERRRNELIHSGLQCAPLYNADYLMQYKFTKKASKEMVDRMLADYNNRETSTTPIKKSVDVVNVTETQSENFETSEASSVVDNHELEITKRELTDFEVAQISSRFKRKIAKKESFIYFPIVLSVYLLIIASIFVVLGVNNAAPEYSWQEKIDVNSTSMFIGHVKNKMIYTKYGITRKQRFMMMRLYFEYQEYCINHNLLDFDQMSIEFLEFLQKNPEEALAISAQYKYIMVDESQDMNRVQYEILKILSSYHNNLFLMGDMDQTVYEWRGSDFKNTLRVSMA